MNVFVKPNEQSGVYSDSAMARKGRMKSNEFGREWGQIMKRIKCDYQFALFKRIDYICMRIKSNHTHSLCLPWVINHKKGLDGVSLRWTGRLIPRQKAMQMFMFKKSYQVQHVNGLTYDFLFDMAKKLPRCRCDDPYGWRTHLTDFERSDPKIREETENYRIWCNSDNNTLLFV